MQNETVRDKQTLATTSLVFGILAFASGPFLVGGLFALVAIPFGVAHLVKKRRPCAMAWVGTSLAIVGLIVSLATGAACYWIFHQFSRMAQEGMGEAAFTEWKGVEAPDFQLATVDGKTITLSDFRGRRVVLDFWATWCPPCVKEIPHFIRLAAENSEEELIIIGISGEDRETLASFIAKKGINYPIAIEGEEMPSPYSDVTAIPTTFFIDRQGVIRDVLTGYHDYDHLKRLALPPEPEP